MLIALSRKQFYGVADSKGEIRIWKCRSLAATKQIDFTIQSWFMPTKKRRGVDGSKKPI